MRRVRVRYRPKKITCLQTLFIGNVALALDWIKRDPRTHNFTICKMILLSTRWGDEFST